MSKPKTATLRLRVAEWLKSGAIAKLGSEGRLMAFYAFHRANWADCTFRMSQRSAAEEIGCSKTSVGRGVEQLIAAGFLGLVEPCSGSRWAKYEIKEAPKQAPPPQNGGHEACPPRRLNVTGVVTPRVRCGHTV